MTILIIFHVIVSVCLVTIVLMQRGRGGGFVENLSGLDSIFGTKTSGFLTKTTTVLATLFFLNCLALAGLSLSKSKSLMHNFTPAASVAATNSTVTNATTTEKAAVETVPVETPAAAVAVTNNTQAGN